MYNTYIVKRTQIYLDEQQAEELGRRAAVRGTTASKMIREAIDQYLSDSEDATERLARWRTAVDESFGIAPHLPDGAEYVEGLRGADRARQEKLEDRARR